MFASFRGETSQGVTVRMEPGILCFIPHGLVALCSSETLTVRKESPVNLSPQVPTVIEGSQGTPKPQITKRWSYWDTLSGMHASLHEHINMWRLLSQTKIGSRNRSGQSKLTVSHRAFDFVSAFGFMNWGKREALLFFILFHYNNYSVNIVLDISFEVWGTSWMMRIQIYYFLK